jgi:hypothetical protein
MKIHKDSVRERRMKAATSSSSTLVQQPLTVGIKQTVEKMK